jgi:hypothetical protein
MGLWNKKPAEGDGTQTKSEADLLVEKLGPVIEAVVKPIRDQVETISTKWNAMEEEAKRGLNEEQQRNAREAEGNLTPEEKQALETKKAFVLNVLTNARVTEEDVIREVRDQWPSLVPRFREVINGIPFDEKSKANYADRCRNAVTLVIGQEARKGGLKQDSNTGKFFLEDAAASTGGDDSPFSDPDLTWIDPRNPDRAPMSASEQLRKLRIDPKQFAEWVKQQGGLA